MLMIKQIWNELRLSKENKSVAVFFAAAILVDLLLRDWWLLYIEMLIYVAYISKKNISKNVPEIMGFLPMEKKARQKYVCVKAYLLSGLVSLIMTVCLVICFISAEDSTFNIGMLWSAFAAIFILFLESSEQLVLGENAGYRKIEIRKYQEMCIPKWCRGLNGVAMLVKIFLISLVSYWGTWFDVTITTDFFDWKWKILMGVLLVFVLAVHIIIMRYHAFIIDMGDYNVSRKEKVIDYEY